MSSNLLSFQYYPIMKNVFENLDAKSLVACFDVSKELREMVILILKNYSDEDWLNLLTYKSDSYNCHFSRDLTLSEEFIETFIEQIKRVDDIAYVINCVINYETLSEDFVRRNRNFLNMNRISSCVKLSEDFMREFCDKLNWWNLSSHQKMSEDFMREFRDKLNWWNLSSHQKMSEDFIREFRDKVYWFDVSYSQKLSEDFMREFRDELDWENLCSRQKMSVDFIKEYKDYVCWTTLIKYDKIPVQHFQSMMYQYKDEIKKSKEYFHWNHYS